MISPVILKLSNMRAHRALALVRVVRNPGTMAELRDALNWRQRARQRHLTRAEQDEKQIEQLRREKYGI